MNKSVALFQIEQRSYYWADVVLSAKLRGDWQEWIDAVKRKILLTQNAELSGNLPSDFDLQAAQRDFRFRHDLVEEDRFATWLTTWNISVDQWMAYLRRTRVSESEWGYLSGLGKVDDELLEETLWVETVCSGQFNTFVDACAGRLALEPSLRNQFDAHLVAQRAQLILEVANVSTETANAILLADAEALYELHRETVEQSSRVNDIILHQQTEWTRFQYEALRFSDARRARDASYCLLGDDMSVRDVARLAKAPIENADVYFEELPDTLKPAFACAQSGDLLPALPINDEYWVIAVKHRTPPAIDCALTRHRALEQALQHDMRQASSGCVNWFLHQ